MGVRRINFNFYFKFLGFGSKVRLNYLIVTLSGSFINYVALHAHNSQTVYF